MEGSKTTQIASDETIMHRDASTLGYTVTRLFGVLGSSTTLSRRSEPIPTPHKQRYSLGHSRRWKSLFLVSLIGTLEEGSYDLPCERQVAIKCSPHSGVWLKSIDALLSSLDSMKKVDRGDVPGLERSPCSMYDTHTHQQQSGNDSLAIGVSLKA
jgi:hypothetical protein